MKKEEQLKTTANSARQEIKKTSWIKHKALEKGKLFNKSTCLKVFEKKTQMDTSQAEWWNREPVMQSLYFVASKWNWLWVAVKFCYEIVPEKLGILVATGCEYHCKISGILTPLFASLCFLCWNTEIIFVFLGQNSRRIKHKTSKFAI